MPDLSQPVGQFDGIHQGHAFGWALHPGQLRTRLTIEVMQGETCLAIGTANLFHKGLAAKKVGDGHFGFAVALPSAISPALPLRVRIAGSSYWLRGDHFVTPPVRATTTPIGNIDGIINGVAFGWVVQTPGHVAGVHAQVGDVILAVAELTGRRPDVEALGFADVIHAFKVDLKPLLKTRKARSAPIHLIQFGTGLPLSGSPFSFNVLQLWGYCETLKGREVQGWVTEGDPKSTTRVILQLWLDGQCIDEQCADHARPDFARLGIRFAKCGFRFQIPARYLDGQHHTLRIQPVVAYERVQLGNCEQSFTRTLHHNVESVNHGVVTGWAFLDEDPQTSLTLQAHEDGRIIGEILANQPIQASSFANLNEHLQTRLTTNPVGFAFAIPPTLALDHPRRICLHLAGDPEPIGQQEILIESRAALIQQAQAAARQNETFRFWANEWINQLRQSRPSGDTLFKLIPYTAPVNDGTPVDIIVPVYKGRQETMACLHSLLATPDPTPRDIIVINDASPDAQLSADLCALAQLDARLTLLENPRNLGFVATVNRGMALHPDRDVLLLNADTLLPASNWLQRLRVTAYRQPRAATVTPFSNRATLCSLPLPNVDNDLPAGHSVDTLDVLCAQINPGVAIEIPTAVGFCMFIKRAALNEVGLFDAERWAKGYGEENDFCLKAASLGWQHLAACDVFIEHHGSVSFQGEKAGRVQENLVKLNALYPDYPAAIQRFLRHDPLAGPRNRVALQLRPNRGKRKKPKPETLHITHAWGGGIEHHVNQRCDQFGYLLRPTREGQLELSHPASGFALHLPMADLVTLAAAPEASALLDTLRQLDLGALHYHQWIGLPPAIWSLPQALGLPYDFTVHDYYSFCPRVVMLDHTGQFCGQAPITRCAVCLKVKPLDAEIDKAYRLLGRTPEAWRAFHAQQLAQARQIIAPCNDAASRIVKAFPLVKVTVKPHEPPLKAPPRFKALPKPGEERRIAVIGAIGPQKGYEQLLSLAQLAEAEASHLRFFIVGYTMDDTPFEALGNVHITGRYEPAELPALLAELDCHIALFLSPWPETYSYTLSEAVEAGLLPIAPALGALGERLIALKTGKGVGRIIELGDVHVLRALLA